MLLLLLNKSVFLILHDGGGSLLLRNRLILLSCVESLQLSNLLNSGSLDSGVVDVVQHTVQANVEVVISTFVSLMPRVIIDDAVDSTEAALMNVSLLVEPILNVKDLLAVVLELL